jgi:urease accessory protein
MGFLNIQVDAVQQKSVLTKIDYTAPYKIAKPFYYPGYTKVISMSATPGILDGDKLQLALTLNEKAALEYTTQSYTKLYKSKASSFEMVSNIGENAYLVYLPCPTIPFMGANHKSRSSHHLTRSSKLIFSEIITSGRVYEKFSFGSIHSSTSVYIENTLVLRDNLWLETKTSDLSSFGYFEGYDAIGSLYLYGFDLKSMAIDTTPELECAVTHPIAGTLIRVLAVSADDIMNLFQSVVSEIRNG